MTRIDETIQIETIEDRDLSIRTRFRDSALGATLSA